MAAFEPAIAVVLAQEGGVVNDSADRGGLTKFGISSKSYPSLNIAALTEEDAKEIYRRDFWDAGGYEHFVSQALANKVFSLAANMGASPAHRLLQSALFDAGQKIRQDGILGSSTLRAANTADPDLVLDILRLKAGQWYLSMGRGSKFLKGWLTRALA